MVDRTCEEVEVAANGTGRDAEVARFALEEVGQGCLEPWAASVSSHVSANSSNARRRARSGLSEGNTDTQSASTYLILRSLMLRVLTV